MTTGAARMYAKGLAALGLIDSSIDWAAAPAAAP